MGDLYQVFLFICTSEDYGIIVNDDVTSIFEVSLINSIVKAK